MVIVSFCWKMNFLPQKKKKKKKKNRFIDDVLEINDQSRCILSGPPCILGKVFHMVFWWSPLIWITMSHYTPLSHLHCFFCWHGSIGFPKHHMKGHSKHNSSLIGRKIQAKLKNDSVSRNGHRIIITQPNSMLLVSFSFAEDAFIKDLKKNYTFSLQGTETPPFLFFGGHPVYFTIFRRGLSQCV